MEKRMVKTILALLFLMLSLGFLGFSFLAKAQNENDFFGWAWSSNIGWVSFNCIDENVCASSDYKVQIDPATGKLSGYAWSSNIGWIRFNPSGPYPENPQQSAAFDSDGNLSGWIRACSVFNSGCSGALKDNLERGSWDGWIKISNAKLINNQLRGGCDTGLGWTTGCAWGSDVVGWLYFWNVAKGSAIPPPPPVPISATSTWQEIIPR